ncbi:hypothetical protein N431DRAFT_384533 [Stipitochalara longipes BDJ]|nr:hypothetical protein N431DRAFT_384533 [Stipitochalara longipes BDJ]
MAPYTLAPITATNREIISTIFCTSYASNPYFRLQYSNLPINDIIPGFALRFPAGNLSKANAWHLKLLGFSRGNEAIAFAHWILPTRVFERLSEELKKEGGAMGLQGESEESLERYRKERELGYVNGAAIGMDTRVPEEAGVALDWMRANAPNPPEEYIELEALHNLQEHERKGAGTALLKWDIRLADSEVLPIRLQSTPQGFELYRQFGFVELGHVTFDLARWGGRGEFT